MRSEDWPRIEELFHNASGLGVAERDAYLARECAGDSSLRREVETLVAASESEASVFRRPVVDDAMRVIFEGHAPSLAGRAVGHYKVSRLLGRGGMGEVYLAEDAVLERPVALKFISGDLVGDEWAREQLTQEARAVARLEHANICAVHGFEEADGRSFIVMQYVEGEALSSVLRDRKPDAARSLETAEQIASALAAAHARGVVHRDVKPQNIIVTPEGQAKVLDFGLAKFVRPKQEVAASPSSASRAPGVTAHAGLVVGTLAYMSPEQARGEALDARSDIFSFGVLLHEMLSGRNPFLRETEEETRAAVEHEEAPHVERLPQPLRGRVERILRKCLAKDRALRYETADELLRDLRAARARPLPLARVAAAAAAVLLALSILAGYFYVKLSKVHTLAVLPIANQSADPEAASLSKGLTRNLFDKFSYLPRLRLRLPSAPPPDSVAREGLLGIGRDLKADAVLSGQVLDLEGSRRLHVTLLRTADAALLWDATFDLDSADVFALQDDITREVSSRLGLWLVGDERSLLTKRQTDSEAALRLYMEGQRYYMNRDRENIKKAIDLFELACKLDPSFAKAYSGLAVSYVLAANVAYGPLPPKLATDKALWNARQAIETGPLLPEAHAAMGFVKMSFLPERQEAEQEFRRAIELDREYAQAHFWYSNLLAASGRFEESVREAEVARGLDPYSPVAEMNYGRALYYARRFDESEAYFRGLLAKSPDNGQFMHMAGYVMLRQGHNDEAVAMFERLHAMNPVYGAAGLGYAYGKTGRLDDARAILRELDERSTPERPIPPFEKALVYIGMGDRDAAFPLLERAYQDQFGQLLLYFAIEPVYDDLRADPRYADLVRRLNLTQ